MRVSGRGAAKRTERTSYDYDTQGRMCGDAHTHIYIHNSLGQRDTSPSKQKYTPTWDLRHDDKERSHGYFLCVP